MTRYNMAKDLWQTAKSLPRHPEDVVAGIGWAILFLVFIAVFLL